MVAEPRLITARQFAQFPEQSQRIQLIGGIVIPSPSPTPHHQSIVIQFLRYGAEVADAKAIGRWYPGPLDIWLSPYDVAQPDLCFFEQGELPDPQRLPVVEIPRIVVEVLSPESRHLDMVEKLPKYAARGVAEYWVIDPDADGFTLNVRNDDGSYSAVPIISGPIPIGLFAGTPIDLDALFMA